MGALCPVLHAVARYCMSTATYASAVWQLSDVFWTVLQVLEWCPKNNLVRRLLGSIKVVSLLHHAIPGAAVCSQALVHRHELWLDARRATLGIMHLQTLVWYQYSHKGAHWTMCMACHAHGSKCVKMLWHPLHPTWHPLPRSISLCAACSLISNPRSSKCTQLNWMMMGTFQSNFSHPVLEIDPVMQGLFSRLSYVNSFWYLTVRPYICHRTVVILLCSLMFLNCLHKHKEAFRNSIAVSIEYNFPVYTELMKST